MISAADARALVDEWKPKFVEELGFQTSWSRYFETATVPDASRLAAWLSQDQQKEAVKFVGVTREPLLPTRSRYELGDCTVCAGKRYVRRDLEVGHPDFGKAIPCPSCNL